MLHKTQEFSLAANAKYSIEVCYLYTSVEEAAAGMLKRYYEELMKEKPSPRYVDIEYILKKADTFDDAVVKCLEYTDNISVINRKGNINGFSLFKYKKK